MKHKTSYKGGGIRINTGSLLGSLNLKVNIWPATFVQNVARQISRWFLIHLYWPIR